MEARQPNVTRINGHRENLDNWTDRDLLNGIDHAMDRLYSAEEDVNKLLGHAILRGLYPAPEDGGDAA